MKVPKTRNWGLKALSLVLAIVVYYLVKNDVAHTSFNDHDRTQIQRP